MERFDFPTFSADSSQPYFHARAIEEKAQAEKIFPDILREQYPIYANDITDHAARMVLDVLIGNAQILHGHIAKVQDCKSVGTRLCDYFKGTADVTRGQLNILETQKIPAEKEVMKIHFMRYLPNGLREELRFKSADTVASQIEAMGKTLFQKIDSTRPRYDHLMPM
ncbi:hypothetical protein [Micavibrio aeruginosavorus]|uniref:hypothetical protein n=1 Tax=Micavibrio aeruginosavorus TaxID=349221 RepID=UPI003F4AD59C